MRLTLLALLLLLLLGAVSWAQTSPSINASSSQRANCGLRSKEPTGARRDLRPDGAGHFSNPP